MVGFLTMGKWASKNKSLYFLFPIVFWKVPFCHFDARIAKSSNMAAAPFFFTYFTSAITFIQWTLTKFYRCYWTDTDSEKSKPVPATAKQKRTKYMQYDTAIAARPRIKITLEKSKKVFISRLVLCVDIVVHILP